MSQRTEQVHHFALRRNMPVLTRRIFTQHLLQSFGHNVSAHCNQQIGRKLLLLCLSQSRESSVKIAQTAFLILQMQVAQMFREHHTVKLLQQRLQTGSLSRSELSTNQHAALGRTKCSSQIRNLFCFYPTDAAHFRHGSCSILKQRLRQSDINLYRSALAMRAFQYRFVHHAVAIPFVFFGKDFGQMHTFLYQRTKHARLRQRLAVHLSDPGLRTIGRNHNQREMLIKGLAHGRMDIQQRGARGAANHHRSVPLLSQTKRHKTCAPLIGHRKALKGFMSDKSMNQRRVPASGAKHYRAHPMQFEQSHQL